MDKHISNNTKDIIGAILCIILSITCSFVLAYLCHYYRERWGMTVVFMRLFMMIFLLIIGAVIFIAKIIA